MKRTICVFVLGTALAMSGCGKAEKPPAPHHSPPKTASHDKHAQKEGVHSLDVFVDGDTIHLLLGEYRAGEEKPVLLYVRSDDNGANFSPPVRVDGGCASPHKPHRGMDAQIAVSGNHLIAAWQTSGTDKWGGGPMAITISSDGGKTWRCGPNPTDDGLTTSHGFIDLAADKQGAFHLVWLDSRGGKQGLHYTRSTDYGATWSKNATLDAETCECCWNSVSIAAENVFVLYRDKAPRDMALAVSRDRGATWTSAGWVGDFGWQFEGCPHVGGTIAVRGETSHAVVWTARDGQTGLYYLSSKDSGQTWSEPSRVGDASARHADIATRDDGSVVVVWDVQSDDSAIFAAIASAGDVTFGVPQRLSDAAAFASHPRIIATREGFRVFWTETGSNQTGVWKSKALGGNEP